MTDRPTSGPYEVFMLVLSIYALAVLTAETLLTLDEQTRAVLGFSDTAVCVLFFADFLHSLAKAPDRTGYMLRWGWLDLISSMPTVGVLRLGRIARVVRVIRVLRGVRATKSVAAFVIRRRAQGAFLAVAMISMLLVVFSSLAILQFETDSHANIRTAADALWWAFTTVTTVGYGDRYPVSGEGRLLAAVLMTAGVGLFGTFSGFVAAWFLSPGTDKQESEIGALRRDVAELKVLLEQKHSDSTS